MLGCKLGQQGFMLKNIITLVVLVAAAIAGWKYYTDQQEHSAALKRMEAGAERIRDHVQKQLKHDLAWKNTIKASENKLLACLRENTSCTGKGGLIAVRDPLNRVTLDSTIPVNGYSPDGAICSWFSDQGNDDCPFRLEVRWEPNCNDTCVKPDSVTFTATMTFRPDPNRKFAFNEHRYGFNITRDTYSTEPRSCAQVKANGQDQDGTYFIRPDPTAPAFPVYCDQTRDGGGWALVANAAKPELGEMPIDNTITLYSHARMAPAHIALILRASEHQSENNLRLILPDIDGGIVVAASTNGGTEAVQYKAGMPIGDCRAVEDRPSFATNSPSAHFSVELSGHGSVGFSDRFEPNTGFLGFHVCFGSSFRGENCGTGCERKWTGSLVRQRGSLWLR